MTPNTHSIKDDISDALFRKMITQNIPLLVIVSVITIGTAGFLYFKIARSNFLVQKEIALLKNGKELSGRSVENQKFLRLLKQRSVRDSLIKKHNLAELYSIDLKNPNAVFQLDKALIDRLKVEEQQKGIIRLRYIGETESFSELMLNDLANLALVDLNLVCNHNLTWKTTHSIKQPIHPKFYSILFLVSTPVLLALAIFIAIKQKLYFQLNNE